MPSTRHECGRVIARCLLPLHILLTLVVGARGAEEAGKAAPKLKFVPACPALVAAANSNHIAMEGLSPASGTNGLRPGDSAAVLVTFFQKKNKTQWLLHLEAATPDPATATNKPATFTVSSAFGPPMRFKSRPYPVKLRMFGPFAAAGKQPKAKETTARFSVNEDFLALGMDQPAALLHRWSKATNFDRAMTSKALLAMNPTTNEQRAICAVFPALISYFEIVQHTEGLEDLLKKLIELPSLWSILRHRGVEMTITFDGDVLPSPARATEWNLESSAAAYYFPWLLRLNGNPALKITLVVTSPQPPLRLCGGVVGLLAEKIGDDQTYMTFRVLSARHKPGSED